MSCVTLAFGNVRSRGTWHDTTRHCRGVRVSAVGLMTLSLIATPSIALAEDGCNNGESNSSFYAPSGTAKDNLNDAWQFRARRTTSAGNFDIEAVSKSGALISDEFGYQKNEWAGVWTPYHYSQLANAEKVINYGAGTTINYNRSCTKA